MNREIYKAKKYIRRIILILSSPLYLPILVISTWLSTEDTFKKSFNKSLTIYQDEWKKEIYKSNK